MRYSTFSIPKEKTQELGIEEIKIERLSNVIAFIGKNGSGKTRILDLIEKYPFSLDVTFENIPRELYHQYQRIEMLKRFSFLTNIQIKTEKILSEIRTLDRQLGSDQSGRNISLYDESIRNSINQKYLCRIKQEEITILESFLKENKEQDVFEKLIENNNTNPNLLTPNNQLSSIKKGALKYILNLPHKLIADDYECKGDKTILSSRITYKRFTVLKKYISIFLNKELEWMEISKNSELKNEGFQVIYKGVFTLNKHEFKHDELSPGEKILFLYAIWFFLFEQNNRININESIILIDEPELHLHADSEIDLITKLREIISEKGQLIIATHSINILSTLNYEDIFVVRDGKIENPSRVSLTHSLQELIGIEEKINKLSDLLISIENYSYINFIKQCLSEQDAIKTLKENDPHLEIIKKIIQEKINNPKTNFLDFGAGRGRILEGLLNNENFSKLKYFALEPNNEYHTEIKKLGIKSIYDDYTKLPDNTFNFILLANVLHEIKITSWETTLNKIIDSLTDDGVILIVEQKILAKGEMIDEAGFIVLDEKGIKTLFDLSNEIKSFYIEGYKDKTTSVVIQKNEINKISTISIIEALTVVQENSLTNIKTLKNQENDNTNEYDRGRKMGFHTMQYVNAKIGIDLLKE